MSERQHTESVSYHHHWISLSDSFLDKEKLTTSIIVLITSVNQCVYGLHIKQAPDVHPCWKFHNITIRSCSFNAFLASISKNPQFSSMWCESRYAACIAPSISRYNPPQRLVVLHVIANSLPATNITGVAMAHHHISLIPMGLTPGI
jgi:hypothetical protein